VGRQGQDLAPERARRGPVITAGDFKTAVQRFSKDEMTQRAAALTYYALLSLFPALLVGVSVLGLFGQQSLVNEAANYLKDAGAPPEVVDAVVVGPAPLAETHAHDWWRVVAVFWITSLVEGIGVSQVFALLPQLLTSMGVTGQDRLGFVGLFGSLLFVLGMPLVPLWGVWADRYSRKAVIARSAVVESDVKALFYSY